MVIVNQSDDFDFILSITNYCRALRLYLCAKFSQCLKQTSLSAVSFTIAASNATMTPKCYIDWTRIQLVMPT